MGPNYACLFTLVTQGVSACCCPTENVAAYLDKMMAPFVRYLPIYVKLQTMLLVSLTLSLDSMSPIRVTIDIKSLYTNQPPTMVDYKLSHISWTNGLSRSHQHNTHLDTPALVELVLILNAFSFNGQHYRLFVGFNGEQIRSSYTGFVPQLRKRYIYARTGHASKDWKSKAHSKKTTVLGTVQ